MQPFTDQKWFLVVLTAIVGFLSYVARDLYDKIKGKKKKEIERTMTEGMRAISQVYQAMESLLQQTPADRVLLLEVTNSGSMPTAGEKVYSRAVEVKLDKESNFLERLKILANYEKILVDSQYVNMVVQAKETGEPYRFNVADHKPCLLRDIYETEGIKYSEIYHIYSDTKRWKQFILSVSTYKENQTYNSEKTRAIINMNVHKIRQTFDQYRKQWTKLKRFSTTTN